MTEATDLMTPFVTISGDKRETLVNDRVDCLTPLREAMKRMCHTMPNGRNYIGHSDAYERDRAIYAERYKTLQNLHDDILHEAMAIQLKGE
jgi:hypothetical protein